MEERITALEQRVAALEKEAQERRKKKVEPLDKTKLRGITLDLDEATHGTHSELDADDITRSINRGIASAHRKVSGIE